MSVAGMQRQQVRIQAAQRKIESRVRRGKKVGYGPLSRAAKAGRRR